MDENIPNDFENQIPEKNKSQIIVSRGFLYFFVVAIVVLFVALFVVIFLLFFRSNSTNKTPNNLNLEQNNSSDVVKNNNEQPVDFFVNYDVLEDGKKVPLEVKVGDKILFGKYVGTELKLDGEDYLMMKEDDVLGVLNK
jgi:co-chaperonin GroES (HSP10)